MGKVHFVGHDKLDVYQLNTKRKYLKKKLRKAGILPPVGVEMNEKQKKISEQIAKNDFSKFDTNNRYVKKRTKEELLVIRAKKSAKDNKLDFNLDVSDIKIPKYCPLLGVKLTFDYTIETRDTYYSIDRIDSNKGYVKGNVHVISFKANTMKNDATKKQLIVFAKRILELYS